MTRLTILLGTIALLSAPSAEVRATGCPPSMLWGTVTQDAGRSVAPSPPESAPPTPAGPCTVA